MQLENAAPTRIDAQAAVPPAASIQAARRATVAPVAAVQAAQNESPPQDEAAAMRNAVASINRYLKDSDKNVHFDIDESTGKTVVRVIDSATQEVIRQMPSEETLAIARAISRMSGLLLAEKA